jgi:hypothetical protein
MKKKFDAVEFQQKVAKSWVKSISPIVKHFYANSKKNMAICKNRGSARTSDDRAYLVPCL